MYFFVTARALDRVISERKKDVVTPCNHVKIYRFLLSGNSTVQTFVLFFRFIDFVKHTKDNASDSRKETIQKTSVFQKEMS